MLDFTRCWKHLEQIELGAWADTLAPLIEQRLSHESSGNLKRWLPVINNLPAIQAQQIELNQDRVSVSGLTDPQQQVELREQLKTLIPWRKGPFHIHGIDIDTEWHSDWKWQRVHPHVADLRGKTVLDVGCGSGYHLWRMLGAGAEHVVGIDPSILFMLQFRVLKHFIGEQSPVEYLPLALEEIHPLLPAFDHVFSMGVIYHRRSPIDHLTQLRACLKPGGQLILETLIIESEQQNVLVPEDRYAKMRNVWFLPNPSLLQRWVERCGFEQVKIVDINRTSLDEQQQTPWMTFESLANFLDPDDPTRTIEGYPAPVRAILTAYRPD